MARLDGEERRLLLVAAGVGERTAVGEDATRDLCAELGQEAGDRVEPPVILAYASARNAAQQADRVRVARVAEHRVDRTLLHQSSCIEHADPVTHLRDHTEVVADEEHSGLELRLELRHEVEHLRLDRRVEPGGGLVQDQELRILRQRHRDHDPLLHPTGELVGVARHHAGGISDLYLPECLERAVGGLAAGGAEHRERLGDLRADPHARIQGRARVLVDHRDRVRVVVAKPARTERTARPRPPPRCVRQLPGRCAAGSGRCRVRPWTCRIRTRPPARTTAPVRSRRRHPAEPHGRRPRTR